MMMKSFSALAALALVLTSLPASADLVPGSTDTHWDAGAEDCATSNKAPPIEVHAYNATTYILREDLCSTWEAPFIYLIVGNDKALLIDTGDVADPKLMPLASTVMGLLPADAHGKLPLIVVHSHTHLDHRAGDTQFQGLPGVTLVPAQLPSVLKYFGFKDWPNGASEVDLGGRIIDVLPAPGHNPAHVVYYDRNTGILFSGDFLLSGRLLVDDYSAYTASAARVAAFVKDRPVSYVLGGHVEEDQTGELFDWQSTYHPNEHSLALNKADLLALPGALERFNGFYTETGGFAIMNPIHDLIAFALAVLLVLVALGTLIYRFIRRRIARRRKAT
jgi:hydroxyacylglutathione hydrolase